MPTTALDRLLFIQGSSCFFCNKLLQKQDASVEHLVGKKHGGNDHGDNLVACCKALNALFADMTVKEKMLVLLNQKGKLKCPNGQATPSPTTPPATK